MTQLRKRFCPQCGYDLDPISNFFDRILDGLGHRGSSFTNIDAATHDRDTDRWLIQEFKQADESLSNGQQQHLRALALQSAFTVWCVWKLDENHVRLWDMRSDIPETLAIQEYQARFVRWWNRELITVRLTITDWELPEE